MNQAVTPRPVFSYLEDAERLGVFVRCPLSRQPTEIFECVSCAHYRGLESSDRQSFRLRCTVPDPVPRDLPGPRAARPLPTLAG